MGKINMPDNYKWITSVKHFNRWQGEATFREEKQNGSIIACNGD